MTLWCCLWLMTAAVPATAAVWGPEERVTTNSTAAETGLNHGALVAADSGDVIAIWAEQDGPNNNFRIYTQTRSPSGVWDPAQLAVDFSATYAGTGLGAKFPALVSLPGDTLLMVWHDYRIDGINNLELFTKVRAPGNMWPDSSADVRPTTSMHPESGGDNSYVPNLTVTPDGVGPRGLVRLPSQRLQRRGVVQVPERRCLGHHPRRRTRRQCFPDHRGVPLSGVDCRFSGRSASGLARKHRQLVPDPVSLSPCGGLMADHGDLVPSGNTRGRRGPGRGRRGHGGGGVVRHSHRKQGGVCAGAITRRSVGAARGASPPTRWGPRRRRWRWTPPARAMWCGRMPASARSTARFSIRWRRRDCRGTPPGLRIRNCPPGSGKSSRPTLITDPAGRTLVLWQDARHGATEIYFRAAQPVTAVPESPWPITASPNPFRSHTTLAGVGWTTVRVYDSAGRLVRELTGQGSGHWDGRSADGDAAAAGVYFLDAWQGTRRHRARVVKLP